MLNRLVCRKILQLLTLKKRLLGNSKIRPASFCGNQTPFVKYPLSLFWFRTIILRSCLKQVGDRAFANIAISNIAMALSTKGCWRQGVHTIEWMRVGNRVKEISKFMKKVGDGLIYQAEDFKNSYICSSSNLKRIQNFSLGKEEKETKGKKEEGNGSYSPYWCCWSPFHGPSTRNCKGGGGILFFHAPKIPIKNWVYWLSL